MRTRYQHGTIELKQRARGPAVWQFRWRDTTGKRRSEDIGTTSEYKNRSAADRCPKVAYLRMKINSDQPAVPDERFGVVLERYVQEEIPKRFSTQHAYLSYINNHIRPKWGESPLTQVKPLAVRDWLKAILDKKGKRPLANKTRGHIKGLMHRIFDCAMLWSTLPTAIPCLWCESRAVRSGERNHGSSRPRSFRSWSREWTGNRATPW